MADGIREHLNTIRTASTKLNESADRLTTAIRTLNDQLVSLNVGIVTYYTDEFYESSSDYESGEAVSCRYYIGYDRDKNGTWGISVMCKTITPVPQFVKKLKENEEPMTTLRWVKAFDACPRNVRLSLAGHVPKIIAGLAMASQKLSTDLYDSISSIESLELTP